MSQVQVVLQSISYGIMIVKLMYMCTKLHLLDMFIN